MGVENRYEGFMFFTILYFNILTMYMYYLLLRCGSKMINRNI